VLSLAVWGTNLYAGGSFTTAGAAPANYIARRDGSNWISLGLGMGDSVGADTRVSALAVAGSDVYAGGNFRTVTNTGGVAVPARGVAKWDGTNWSALGSGLGGANSLWVDALTLLGSDLYAGGSFSTAGGVATRGVAKWDGTNWSALGLGVFGNVTALVSLGNDLYVGCGAWATNSGGAPVLVNGIAKWDGTSWSPLGSGVGGGRVYALAVSGTNLYVGGDFSLAGGISATNGVAKWDGTSWSALDSASGLVNKGYPYTPIVFALAVVGHNLYAGGAFTTTDGTACNNIAKWDGSAWTGLGSGTVGGVSAIAVSGGELIVGGGFLMAGGKVSAYLAKAIVNPPILAIEPDGFGGYFIDFSGVPGSAYRLQRAPSLSGPWTTSAPQTAPGSGQIEFWDLFPPPGQGFYRTVQP
jgi:hypothetical protein